MVIFKVRQFKELIYSSMIHRLIYLFLILGVYSFCIDNSLSRFNAKLVSLYCASYKRDEWEKLVNDVKDSDGTVSNMTVSFFGISIY